MDPLDLHAVSKLTDITISLKPSNHHQQHQQQSTPTTPVQALNLNPLLAAAESSSSSNNLNNLSKYAQLLLVIEEMSREIRPTYSGNLNFR